MSAPAPNRDTVEPFTRSFPCIACNGHRDLARGKGVRCYGFVGSDGLYFRCSRDEFAGAIEAGRDGLFVHRTSGSCNCGATHREADDRSIRSVPQSTSSHAKGPTVHPTRERLKRAAEFSADGKPVTAEYEYEDADGALCLIVFRVDLGDGDKTFRQGRPEGGGFVLSSKGAALVPYHLPQLRAVILAGETVFIVEGEKDVHAVEGAGFPATCNPMGAGKNLATCAKHFEGADLVRIVADRDDVGRKHAQAWADLLQPIANRVEIVEPIEGKDAYDALVTHEMSIEEAFAVVDLVVEPDDSKSDQPPRNPEHQLPFIQVNAREARDVVADMIVAVSTANTPPTLFSRIGHVVRIVRNDLGVGEARRITGADQLNVASGAANFTRFDARAKAEVTTHPRHELCAAAFARLEAGEELPRLRSVTSTPIIHEDGEIIDVEGYDPETGAYFAPAAGFELGAVPEKPTHDEAQKAVSTLMAPFTDLPFATDFDCANFVATLITVVIRQWFRTVPFIVFEAPIQGSGKTLAAMGTRVIAEGTSGIGAAPEAGKQGDAEWRKRIMSILLTAPSVAIIDNVTGTLGGPTLAALSTSAVISDRMLGTNEAPDLPNTATWMFTTNNAQVDADLLRRCVFIRLDPRDPAPHLRDGFQIPDLVEHLEQHRGEILAALYTVVRFWITRGKPGAPKGTPLLGSFEKWSRIVPAILGSVGITGVLGDIESRSEMMRDPSDEEAADFLIAWWEGFPGLRDMATARELVTVALAPETPGSVELPLPSAVTRSKTRDRAISSVSRSLGRWLKFRRDRMCAVSPGVTFTVRLAGGSEKRGFRWKVERSEIGGES